MELSKNLLIFAAEKVSFGMSEENKDLEKKSCMACEPVAAVATEYHDGVVTVHDEIDDLDWDRMPFFGPKTVEEAIARVDQAWEDRNDPTKWRTSEEMWNQIYAKYPWLR